MLALKFTLEEWWLEGTAHPFTIITENKNLEYLKTVKHLNSQQAWWTMFFACFIFMLSYRLGSKNTKANCPAFTPLEIRRIRVQNPYCHPRVF